MHYIIIAYAFYVYTEINFKYWSFDKYEISLIRIVGLDGCVIRVLLIKIRKQW